MCKFMNHDASNDTSYCRIGGDKCTAENCFMLKGKEPAESEIESASNFIDDQEKMYDLIRLSKNEFLKSYSYLTEKEYDSTVATVIKMLNKLLTEPEALTLEQLKQMNEEPVWIEFFSKDYKNGKLAGWALVETRYDQDFLEISLDWKYYGKSWFAYSRKPKNYDI